MNFPHLISDKIHEIILPSQGCQHLPNFQFLGGGYSFLPSQNSKCQDAKICLISNFSFLCVCVWGGGGGKGAFISQNSKCQHLPNFQFFGGYSCLVKTASAKICLTSNLRAVVYSCQVKIWPTFHFRGWEGVFFTRQE